MRTNLASDKLSPDDLEQMDVKNQFGRFAIAPQARGLDVTWHDGEVSLAVRQKLLRQRAATLWLTGLSGSGKSTIAFSLEKFLLEKGHACFALDGDNLRHHLNSDLGFSPANRRENIRRAAEVAHLMNEAGMIVITAFISPFQADRAMAREIIQHQRFIEVHISTSVPVCEQRDPKGLYQRARSGEIPEFTGVSSPYEKPLTPEMTLDAEFLSIESATRKLYDYLIHHNFIE
ncbi:adenylyl-sulfate kinase [Undibacterium sp. Jales W-56]|uniref:adenylyl-sulfate kinase n=1 Tax=Undibacterium sp. Jales W-56 TaxID=2897325 RepID=UPI0021D1E7FD|nr:adenylyl-sulfate kinase [Undibacterium sp. Jales W-56]MCU6434889.1 adenylyl-sulfate kinase [Undibacterium sp. Jales W-56]